MNNDFYDKYVIKTGDTIYGISRKYNINPELLSLVNGLNMNDYIYEGQSIMIPKSGFSYYLTKSGDDLNSVLQLFDINFDKFSSLNKNVLLEEGQLFVHKR